MQRRGPAIDDSRPIWRTMGIFLIPLMLSNVLQSACWTSGSLPHLDEHGDVTVAQQGPVEEYRTELGQATIINLTPWFHAMGAIGYLNGMVMSGTTVVIHDRFDPAAYVADAVKHRVTSIGGAPPIFVALLALYYAGIVVGQQHGRVADQGARQRQPASLPARHLRSALADPAIQPVGQRAHHVGDGDDRERQPIGPSRGRVCRRRARGAHAPADDVGADDEVTVRIERSAGARHQSPPPGSAALRVGRSHVLVARQGVTDQDGVGAGRIQPPIGAVGDVDLAKHRAGIEAQRLGQAKRLAAHLHGVNGAQGLGHLRHGARVRGGVNAARLARIANA